mgnify:CR=1 FL=1
MTIGIDQISFAIPRYYLDLAVLAERQGVALEKFHQGIGQEQMAQVPPDEDMVTLAAKAAAPLLDADSRAALDTILLATESGIDQSKAAGLYVQRLLNLPSRVRIVELKQACYSATAGLQLAAALVARRPDRKVLLIASDVAKYDLDSPAEITQGAGAVAMLISAAPRVLALGPVSGCYSEEVMDFWRPNGRKTPLVDGRFSTLMYLKALENALNHYKSQGGNNLDNLAAHCYHLPFTKMGLKAHQRLCKLTGQPYREEDCAAAMSYNRQIGNCYSASLYLSLCSLLDNNDDLAGREIGLFSYGSGAVAEFFTGQVQENYRQFLQRERHRQLLAQRQQLSYEEYLQFWPGPDDSADQEIADSASGTPRLAAIEAHKRLYQ